MHRHRPYGAVGAVPSLWEAAAVKWLAQFLEIGVPRCSEYGCHRLILPWQDWVCEVESWPVHHACFHAHTEEMLAFIVKDEAENGGGYHWDGYDTCGFCKRTTPLAPVSA